MKFKIDDKVGAIKGRLYLLRYKVVNVNTTNGEYALQQEGQFMYTTITDKDDYHLLSTLEVTHPEYFL